MHETIHSYDRMTARHVDALDLLASRKKITSIEW